MAAEQEADREAQAKIAAAHGELSASENLKAASDVMKSNPIALQVIVMEGKKCIFFLLYSKNSVYS